MPLSRPALRGLSLALATLLVATSTPLALAQQAVTGSSAEVVQLDVVVTDSNGRPIRDLTKADFDILEDGKPQTISVFAIASCENGVAYQSCWK